MNRAVAVITGVSSGIGNATARALVARGYRVFGTARSEASIVPEKVERVLLDVRDGESIQRGVDEVLAKAGHIDLLVNNAGGSLNGAFEETPLGQARDLFDLNFFGAVRMTQAVLPAMRARKNGRIVFISSVLGFLPAPVMRVYAASNAAPRLRGRAARWPARAPAPISAGAHLRRRAPQRLRARGDGSKACVGRVKKPRARARRRCKPPRGSFASAASTRPL